jgi:hypothetical protein
VTHMDMAQISMMTFCRKQIHLSWNPDVRAFESLFFDEQIASGKLT